MASRRIAGVPLAQRGEITQIRERRAMVIDLCFDGPAKTAWPCSILLRGLAVSLSPKEALD